MREFGICMGGNENYIISAITDVVRSRNLEDRIQYVEIGVAEGKTFSAVCELLNEICVNWDAVAIDIEKGWSLDIPAFKKNTAEFGNKIGLLLMGSPLALSAFSLDSIDIAFIDGDHSEEAVIIDFEAVEARLKKGGIIIFHDTDLKSQGLDADVKMQANGIGVRAALNKLGLLDGINKNFILILDYEGDAEKRGRGIVIVKKL